VFLEADNSKSEFRDNNDIVQYFSARMDKDDANRTLFLNRKSAYLNEWDNFTSYSQTAAYANVSPKTTKVNYLHYPFSLEKIIQWQASIYKLIFSNDPWFTATPLSDVTKEQAMSAEALMQYVCRDHVNYKRGMKPVIEEVLFETAAYGWGIIIKQWVTKRRKINGVVKNSYEGVVLRTIPQEDCYFPSLINESDDLQNCPYVGIQMYPSKSELLSNPLYDMKAVEAVLKAGSNDHDSNSDILRQQQDYNSGITNTYDSSNGYPIQIFYATLIGKDGIAQEKVITMSKKARVMLSIQNLEEENPSYTRPVYKFSLKKRPRSPYDRGFCEILYPFNQEIDDYHNLRRENAYVSGIPWGTYRASSGLEKNAIEIQPGTFIPTEEPAADLRVVQTGNNISWTYQAEQFDFTLGDRITSQPALLQGQVPDTVGPLRSTSGVRALLTESQTPRDLDLDHIRGTLNLLLRDIYAEYSERLPATTKVRLLSSKSKGIFGADFINVKKDDLQGEYEFSLMVNDAQYNPEVKKQNDLALAQVLINQANLQTGIVTPANMYNILTDIVQDFNKSNVESYVTPPQNFAMALNLNQEVSMLLGGRMPVIVMNDNHEAKLQGLLAFVGSPDYQEGLQLGTVTELTDALFKQAIKQHMEMAQILQQAQAMPNQSGLEIPLTAGARQAGTLDGQGRPINEVDNGRATGEEPVAGTTADGNVGSGQV